MSGAGTAAKPKYRFCWACSRQLHGNTHRVVVINPDTPQEFETVVHAHCAVKDDLMIKPEAHLADTKKPTPKSVAKTATKKKARS